MKTFRRLSGTAVFVGVLLVAGVAMAYTPGTVGEKAKPLIELLKDVAEPLAYGCYIWAFIRYILGQRAEAMQMFKSITWGYIGIQVLPWIFDIVKSIGE